jgi:hypothetical protein
MLSRTSEGWPTCGVAPVAGLILAAGLCRAGTIPQSGPNRRSPTRPNRYRWTAPPRALPTSCAVFLPVVLAYQGWAHHLFRRWIGRADVG